MASSSARMLRHLQSTESPRASRNGDGPFAILIMVCVLFCCIWIPMFCQRRCRRQQQRELEEWEQEHQSSEAAAEIIRLSLRNLNLLQNNMNENDIRNIVGSGGGIADVMYSQAIRGMSLEDRKEFVQNVLVSKKIIQIMKCDDQNDENDKETCEQDKNSELPSKDDLDTTPKKVTLIMADVVDADSTSKVVTAEACPICLVEYEKEDVLCWSQNSRCQHYFHRDCMAEWLLRNEECPLCRNNYLGFSDDDEGIETNNRLPSTAVTGPVRNVGGVEQHNDQDRFAYLRGMQLVHLLQSLQAIADTRPNTTIRLEGVELANGRRGNLEIQRSEAENVSTGLNITVSNADEDDGNIAASASTNPAPVATTNEEGNGDRGNDRRNSSRSLSSRSSLSSRWAALTTSGSLRFSSQNSSGQLSVDTGPDSNTPPGD
mmetsp:Transcript_7755/g.12309  ORF Transcript_7755/g.12309 Transcript_7755/m.12309 type:complete len:431 (-) Transcript_7755:756-2048(-)